MDALERDALESAAFEVVSVDVVGADAIDASSSVRDASAHDANDPALDGTLPCDAGLAACSGTCVNLATSVSHCGACRAACPLAANGTVACVAGACTLSACNAGFHRVAGRCVANAPAQLLAPFSLQTTTQRRPRLRWKLPEGADGAVIQLCRDRACSSVIETLRVTGTSAQPTSPLAGGSVVFWRARASVGVTDDVVAGWSPTWLFRVPARDATGGVDASSSPLLDVNGDGFGDLLVGEPRGVAPYAELGFGYVYFGSAAGLSATADRTLSAVAPMNHFAAKSANAGDLNGDGFADIAVSAMIDDQARGSVSVYYGSPSGPAATASVVLRGVAIDQRFGSAIAGLGDVDGDGFGDLGVYSQRWNRGGLRWVGKVSIYFGSAAGVLASRVVELEGESEFGGFGEALSTAGDVDADGYADVLVGTASRNAYLYYGSTTGLLGRARVMLSGATGFGRALADAGDVDGDGYSDVLVGYPAATAFGAANVFVFHGSAAGLMTVARTTLVTPVGAASTGVALARAGDVDGDGYGDVLLGVMNAPLTGNPADLAWGWAAVYRGSASGLLTVPARSFWGPRSQSSLGCSVSSGDVNGDGYSDVVVGARSDSTRGDLTPGSAHVHMGSATGLGATATRSYWGLTRGFGASLAM